MNRSDRAVEKGQILESGERLESCGGKRDVIRTVGETKRDEVAEGF